MIKWMCRFMVIASLVIVNPFDSGEAKAAELYGAIGTSLSFPASLRLGGRNWEGGLLSPGVLGVVRGFKMGSGYFNIGPALTGSSFGLMGGLGLRLGMTGPFYLRGEVNALASINGGIHPEAILGLSIIW